MQVTIESIQHFDQIQIQGNRTGKNTHFNMTCSFQTCFLELSNSTRTSHQELEPNVVNNSLNTVTNYIRNASVPRLHNSQKAHPSITLFTQQQPWCWWMCLCDHPNLINPLAVQFCNLQFHMLEINFRFPVSVLCDDGSKLVMLHQWLVPPAKCDKNNFFITVKPESCSHYLSGLFTWMLETEIMQN